MYLNLAARETALSYQQATAAAVAGAPGVGHATGTQAEGSVTADQQRTASPPSHADQATPSALADADSTDDSRAAPLARQTLPEAATQPCSKADSAPDVMREKTETYANLLSKAGLDDDEDEDASPMANGEVNNSSRAAAGQSAAEPERGSMLSPSEEAAAHAQVTGADKIPSGQAQPAKQPAGESAAEVLPVAGASSRQPPSEMVKAVKRFVHGQLEPLVQSKVLTREQHQLVMKKAVKKVSHAHRLEQNGKFLCVHGVKIAQLISGYVGLTLRPQS